MNDFLVKSAIYLPLLLEGVTLTLVTTFGAVLLSTVLGLIWAIMSWSRFRALKIFSRGFITIIRGIPIIVQLFYIYFVMPDLGLNLTARHIRPKTSEPGSRR